MVATQEDLNPCRSGKDSRIKGARQHGRLASGAETPENLFVDRGDRQGSARAHLMNMAMRAQKPSKKTIIHHQNTALSFCSVMVRSEGRVFAAV
jgi:hypothetical protein